MRIFERESARGEKREIVYSPVGNNASNIRVWRASIEEKRKNLLPPLLLLLLSAVSTRDRTGVTRYVATFVVEILNHRRAVKRGSIRGSQANTYRELIDDVVVVAARDDAEEAINGGLTSILP